MTGDPWNPLPFTGGNVRQRKQFTISRWLSESRPLSTGRLSYIFWIHYALTGLFLGQGKPDDANAHIEQPKPYAVDSAYNQGRVMEWQAKVWYFQHKAEDAKSRLCMLPAFLRSSSRAAQRNPSGHTGGIDHKFISPRPAF